MMGQPDEGNWKPTVETHRQWRLRRAREGQRFRRARMRRIDFYVDLDTGAIIDALRRDGCGGDMSTILNTIVREWSAATKRRRITGIK